MLYWCHRNGYREAGFLLLRSILSACMPSAENFYLREEEEKYLSEGGPMNLGETLYRIHHEKLYYCDNEDLMKEQGKYLDMLFTYNQLPPSKGEEKKALLKKMFGRIGDNCYIGHLFTPTGEARTYIWETMYMPILTWCWWMTPG